MPVTEGELKALISLLDDDNHTVSRLVREKFLEIGSMAKPYLTHASETQEARVRTRARSILEDIHYGELEADFRRFGSRSVDLERLEEGVFLLARFGYPELEVATYGTLLDEMGSELRTRLEGKRNGLAILRAFADFLFDELGFTGNSLDYYDPDNSYMNRVLDRRSGVPISLSLVYLFLARRIGLAMEGIGLPGHFVVRLPGVESELYVDAFDSGRVLSRAECARFVVSAGYEPRPEYFTPSPPREILARMLRNLIHIYREGNDKRRVDRLTQLAALLNVPPASENR